MDAPQRPASLDELRSLCLKKHDAWISTHVYRKISIPFTWALLATSLRPNHVTFLGLVTGLVGAFALVARHDSMLWTLVGVALLQLAVVLDHVDGELARARSQSSPGGFFFDNVAMEILIHMALSAAIAWGAFLDTGAERWLWWGAAFVALKALNLQVFLLKGLVSLKYPAAAAKAGAPGRAPLRQQVASRWWEVKKMINVASVLAVADVVLLSQGLLPYEYRGLPFTLLGAYVAVGIPLLAFSLLLDVWGAARGGYQTDVEPYR